MNELYSFGLNLVFFFVCNLEGIYKIRFPPLFIFEILLEIF